ncbi:phosphotransferase [Streptomyces sp. NPDC054855]
MVRQWAWAERGEELARWEARCSMAGDTLVHADLRADNVLLAAGSWVLVADWAAAVRGAPWVNPAYVCAQLVMSGWEPAAAEQPLIAVGRGLTVMVCRGCDVWLCFGCCAVWGCCSLMGVCLVWA